MLVVLIVVLYFAATLLIGVYSKGKLRHSRAFDGVGLGTLLCVFAGAGEWCGGTSTTGVSEYGFLYGISGAWYTIANGLGVCFLALGFVKLFRRLESPTVAGIVGKYIGQDARRVSSALLIVVMMAVGISQMVAIGSIGESLFNITYNQAILIIGLIIVVYTALGGMMAVAYTNILHMVVLYGGMLAALIFCIAKVGDLKYLSQQLPESYFSMTSIGMPKVSSWLIASILGACTAQAGLQPILAAKDEHTAKKSSLIIAAIIAPFGIITAILGMYAKVMFPDLSTGKQALTSIIMWLPDVISGIVIAGIIAAILSTASPIFLSCGTLFTRDVIVKENSKNHLMYQRVVTLISGSICVLMAIILGDQAIILDLVYFAYGIRGSLFVVLFMAIYWKKTRSKAAITAMILTMIVSFFWILYKNITGSFPIHSSFTETYAAVITAFSITFLGSLIQRKEVAKNEKDNY